MHEGERTGVVRLPQTAYPGPESANLAYSHAHRHYLRAKTNLSELLKQVQAGETIIITSGREKTPVAKLEAITPKKTQRLGLLAHLNIRVPDSVWDPLREEELRLWNEGEDDDPLYTGKPR